MKTLKQEHRNLEQLLDRVLAEVRAGSDWPPAFRAAWTALEAHYGREDIRFRELGEHKMLAQHGEARELASAVEEALAAGQTADAARLVRRFHAIAQHNIIEEERDLYKCRP